MIIAVYYATLVFDVRMKTKKHSCFPKKKLKMFFTFIKSVFLSDDLFKELCTDAHSECMRIMDKATTDESRRLADTLNDAYSGMPGSFRTLCVD